MTKSQTFRRDRVIRMMQKVRTQMAVYECEMKRYHYCITEKQEEPEEVAFNTDMFQFMREHYIATNTIYALILQDLDIEEVEVSGKDKSDPVC